MCRWIAYFGEPIHPSAVVMDVQNSLVSQSLNSPLGKETVNGDGFGLGWYPDAGADAINPAVFRSVEPAWNDQNLRELSRTIRSPLFFAHVRAAPGPPIQQTNCHPFRYDNWLFMHNGALDGFSLMKRDLAMMVEPELFPLIQGTTDSEMVFYLALTLGLRDDPLGGMARTLHTIEEVGHAVGIPYPVQGTFAVADGHTIWAFRYSTQHQSRSLFHSADIPTLQRMYPDLERLRRFGPRTRLIVSEPLSDLPGAFIEVPESTAVIVDDAGYRHEPFLAEALSGSAVT